MTPTATASLMWPDGGALTYTFSSADQFAQVEDSGGVASVALAYDGIGRLAALTRKTAHGTSFGYDAADQLTSLGQSFAGGGGDVSWAYTYTPAGQVVSGVASTSQFDWAGVNAVTAHKAFDGLNLRIPT